MTDTPALLRGLRANRPQVTLLILQVLFVGLTLGTLRTVIPALAEQEFGVARGSFVMLSTFVAAFGLVKGLMNFVAGRMSEQLGRRTVLIFGWVLALPIPPILWLAPSWGWVVFATVLLGVNQGLTWSMSQTAKLDLTRPHERGLSLGLNEFAGYSGVALGGIATAYAAAAFGPRLGLMIFGTTVVVLALASAFAVRETLPWARAEPQGSGPEHAAISTAEAFARMSWREPRLAAVSQAGMVEKFVDALIWVILPVHLFAAGLSLPEIGWVAGIYGIVWGASQIVTGPLSDRVGRFWPNVGGMWICGAGVALMVLGQGIAWWGVSAAITGFGMALLYPNLSAAVADLTPANWRGTAIGIYRFWRDIGYGIGALGLGIVAQATGSTTGAFWFVAIAMGISGLILFVWGEESHTPGAARD